MKKVLISAFKPFNKSVNNYSQEVLKLININSTELNKVIIDVVYDKCFECLKEYNLDQYDLIVALGEARMRDVLTVEKQAHNVSSCSIPDNAGVLKKDEIIDNDLPNELQTNLDLESLKEYGDISYDPGKFVCNNLYFHLLKYSLDRCLFIHIPNCYDDEGNYYEYARSVENIILKILN